MSIETLAVMLVGAVMTAFVRHLFGRLERRMEGIEALALRVEVLHERVSVVDRVVRDAERELKRLSLEHAERAGRCGT